MWQLFQVLQSANTDADMVTQNLKLHEGVRVFWWILLHSIQADV